MSSIDSSIDLSNEENIKVLNQYVSNYLEDNILSYLYKTSKEYHTDIADFGKYVLPKYNTWNEWLDSDWLNNYSNASFSVTVNTQIQGGYLYTKI